LAEVEKINSLQKKTFFDKIRSALWTLRGKRIALLGLAFKGDTDDIRDSPALDIIKMLLHEGCILAAHDPAAIDRAKEVFPESAQMHYADDPYAAANNADALVILTDWQQFAELDLARLNKELKFPIVIDGRNLFDPAAMRESNFTYISVGRPAVYPSREWYANKRLV
jgi:UDPglucose 6-dehydrogenase